MRLRKPLDVVLRENVGIVMLVFNVDRSFITGTEPETVRFELCLPWKVGIDDVVFGERAVMVRIEEVSDGFRERSSARCW